MQQITNWSDALLSSLTGAAALFFAAVPRLIGFAIILIAGWIIAALIEKAVVLVLRAVSFNLLADLRQWYERAEARNASHPQSIVRSTT